MPARLAAVKHRLEQRRHLLERVGLASPALSCRCSYSRACPARQASGCSARSLAPKCSRTSGCASMTHRSYPRSGALGAPSQRPSVIPFSGRSTSSSLSPAIAGGLRIHRPTRAGRAGRTGQGCGGSPARATRQNCVSYDVRSCRAPLIAVPGRFQEADLAPRLRTSRSRMSRR